MRILPAALFSLATVGLLAAIASGVQAAPRAARGKLSSQVMALADKWARARGLPLGWVLATILSESNGNPSAVGDGGVSVGLMQVNTRAHAATLAAAGVTREALFDPGTNLEWGTRILKDAHERVKAALAMRGSAVPVDVLVRLTYKGVDAPSAVRAGRDPRVPYVAAVETWRQNLARASALV